MVRKTVIFIALICAALACGLTVAHDLEIPGKQMLNGPEWITVQHSFYGGFAIVGGIAEVLGLISAGLLVYLFRKQRIHWVLALLAALGFAGMLVLFAVGNNPLNQQIASWTPENLPANWYEVRAAWDSFHAASSALAGVALILLIAMVLRLNKGIQA